MHFLLNIAALPADILVPPAYIDPTAGGMLVQVLLGSAAGILLILKLFWRHLKRIFTRKQLNEPPDFPGQGH